MNPIYKIRPLVLFAIVTLFYSIKGFKDPGEEGWGILVGIIIVIVSIFAFLIALTLKYLSKNKTTLLIIETLITLLLTALFFYWKIF